MYKLAMLINSRMYEFPDVFVTDKGLEGNLKKALSVAGLAGQVCCFPQLDGIWYYGFMACLCDYPGRPTFWVLMPDLNMPQVNLLRPVSWQDAYKAMSTLTAAEFAEGLLVRDLQEYVPEWPAMDMVTRLATLSEAFEEEPWVGFVAEVVPCYGLQEKPEGDIEGAPPKAFINEIIIILRDGSKLLISSFSNDLWPRVMNLGTLKTVTHVGEDKVSHESYLRYELASIGRA